MGLFRKRNKSNESSDSKSNENKQSVDANLDEFTKDMIQSANNCINHFRERFGDKLDFSVKSLELIDTILEEASEFYDEIEQAQINWIINAVGSYIFEVARKNYGGKYYWFDQRNQPILVTGQPDFEISIIVFDKVKGRMENGKEDNIPFFFKGYTERVENAKSGDKATIV